MSDRPDAAALRATLARLGFDASAVTPVGGGDISASYRIDCQDGMRLFVKRGGAAVLAAERMGLAELGFGNHGLVVPASLAYSETDSGSALLVLEWLESSRPDRAHWVALGRGLAELHRRSGEGYGFREDNFIGRLPQVNSVESTWTSFFLRSRLEPQVRMSRERGSWEDAWTPLYSRLATRLEDLLPDRPLPSLVHGDLWSGNAMATVRGPAIFDPAAHYAHREVDVAMTELFGGFSDPFYSAYREAFPLASGYEDRKDVYNLYHLLNHLNHFGAGYAGSVDRILRKYGS